MGRELLCKVERVLEEKRDLISAVAEQQIVLYPYGEIGKYVESWILENYNLVPCFYIDNYKADGDKILNLNQAALREEERFVVLITSDSEKYYEEIRSNLYKALSNTKVIDLFEKAKAGGPTLRKDISIEVEKTQHDKPLIWRKAKAYTEYFDKKSIEIKNNDILIGVLDSFSKYQMVQSNFKEVVDLCKESLDSELYNFVIGAEKDGLICSNMGLHVIPAYDRVLQEGLQSYIDKISYYQKKNDNKECAVVYESQKMVLEGFQRYILRCADAVRNSGIDNAENLYYSLRNIAEKPPQSLYEAVQLLFFLHVGVIDEAGSGSISFGRLDKILYPYYKKDVELGNIDQGYAQDLITELYRKVANLPRSWQNVTLGGSDEFGNDESNELTIMCLNASLEIHADQPQVSIRTNENMPQQVWDKAFEVIKTGRGIPALFNDRVAVKAKISAGIKEEDAWDYGIVGCVELSAGGKEYSHTEGMRINWAKIIDLMICGDEYKLLSKKYSLDEFQSFADFYEAYKQELSYVAKQCCDFLERAKVMYAKNWPTVFTSCFMEGCIESGKDVTDNGTLYNNMTINAVGVASTVDSLQVIETLIYQNKLITFNQLKEVLECNFENAQFVYEECLKCDRFGNDLDEVDKKAVDLVELFTKTIRDYSSNTSDTYQVGYYTSYFHSDFGKKTKALPDGKKHGMPLSSSLSPVSGMDHNGPIAVLNSLNKIDMSKMANGMVLDMRFMPTFFEKKENTLGLQELVKTYFQKGGMEIQFNTVDGDVLREAQKNPLKYKDLIVRVSGFSSYFADLDKELQDEIISRTANA